MIIGTGNVAWHLLNRLQSTAHQVLQLVNLHSHHISPEFELFRIPHCFSISHLNLSADIYLIAVKDDEIGHLHLPVCNNKQIVLHTSGTVDIEVLKKYGNNYGCLYPLQSFTKGIPVNFNEVPLIIESSNRMTLETTTIFANSLSDQTYYLSLQQRRIVHLTAVIVNNFTNHLFVQAQKKLDQFDISFDILKPLIQETFNKLSSLTPSEAQTGPAKRNDTQTILAHEKLLEDDDMLLQIYKTLTASILQQNKLKR